MRHDNIFKSMRACVHFPIPSGRNVGWNGLSQYSRIIYDYTNIHDCIVMDVHIVIDYSIEAS